MAAPKPARDFGARHIILMVLPTISHASPILLLLPLFRCRERCDDERKDVRRGERVQIEMVLIRWGVPPPRTGEPPDTNIHNTSSPRWRGCSSPRTAALSRPTASPSTRWFALNDERPLFAFAGIWTTFNGDRGTKSKPIPRPHQVYGFLTTAPNAVVEPIHPKAMPILTTDDARAVGRGEGVAASATGRGEDRRDG